MALSTSIPAELFRMNMQLEKINLDAVRNQLEGDDTPVDLTENDARDLVMDGLDLHRRIAK